MGDYTRAHELFAEALATGRQVGDLLVLVEIFAQIADSAVDQEDVATAQAALSEGLPLARQLEKVHDVAYFSWNAARLAALLGDTDQAVRAAEESVAMYRALRHPMMIGASVMLLAYLTILRRDLTMARRLTGEVLTITAERGIPQVAYYGLDVAVALAVASNQPERAARLAGACTALRLANNVVRHPIWKTLLRRAGVGLERPTEAVLAAVWDEGERMPLDEAIRYALSDEGM
jgi:hypothetical protein